MQAKAMNILRCVMAFCLLSAYLLPNTVWSGLMPMQARYWLEKGGYAIPQALLIAALLLLAWLSYRDYVRADRAKHGLWLLLGIALANFAVTCLNLPPVVPVISTCTIVLLSVGAGLTFARLCDRYSQTAGLLTLMIALQCAYAIYGYISHTHVFLSGALLRAGGTFDQPTQLSFVLVVLLPILAIQLLEAKTVRATTTLAITVAVCSCALLLSGSRGAIIGLIVSLLWQCFSYHAAVRVKTRLAVSAALLLCAFVMLFIVSGMRNADAISRRSTARSSQGHVWYWKRGWNVFTQHWLTGAGAGSTLVQIPVVAGGITQEMETVTSNNLVIQWLGEFGIGGGILLALIGATIRRILSAQRSALAIGLAGAWLSFFIASLFNVSYGASNLPGGALIGVLFGLTLQIKPASLSGTPLTGRQEEQDKPDKVEDDPDF